MAIGIAGALLGSAATSAGGSLLSTILNAKFQSGENELDRLQSEYLTRLQQNNALQQMRVQHGYETHRYQDLVQDLEAAGLNPASAFGTSGISSPNSGIAGAGIGSGSHGNNHLGAALDFGSGAFNSAIAYLNTHDKLAAAKLRSSIVNSALQKAKEDKAVNEFKGKTVADYMKEQGVTDMTKLDFSKIKV